MANRTVSNAGGNWSTTGAWVEAAVPTASDDVIATATSGALTVDNNSAVCRSADFTNLNTAGSLTLAANSTLTIGTTTANGTKALFIPTTLTVTVGSATTSIITFASNIGSTTLTADFGGKTVGMVTINNTNSSDTLQLTGNGFLQGATSTVTYTQGGFNTNNLNCTMGIFSSPNTNVRALTLGTSTLTLIGGSANVWNINTGVNLTLSAASSTLTFTGTSVTFAHVGNATYGTINITGLGNTTRFSAGTGNTITCATFNRPGTAALGDGLTLLGNLNVTSSLTLTGNSLKNRLRVGAYDTASGNNNGTATLTAPVTQSITNVNFHDIVGAGNTIAGTSIGDMGGNSGITFDGAVTRYRVGAGGNYSATANWSTSSGGAGGQTAPLPQDTVFIDGGASGTITGDLTVLGKDIDFTSFAGTMGMSTTPNYVCGNLTLATGMTITASQTLFFFSHATQTITSNGKQFPQAVTCLGRGGTVTLADNFSSAGTLTLLIGVLDALTNNVNTSFSTFTIPNQIGNSTRTFSMGSGKHFINATLGIVFNVNSGGVTINQGTSNIIINTVSTSSRTIAAGTGFTFYDLTYTIAGSTGVLQLNFSGGNSMTFHSINAYDWSAARTVTIVSASTIILTGNLNMFGQPAYKAVLNALTPTSAATLSKTSGVISLENTTITDITASGGAYFSAGRNSTTSNSTGWNILKRNIALPRSASGTRNASGTRAAAGTRSLT